MYTKFIHLKLLLSECGGYGLVYFEYSNKHYENGQLKKEFKQTIA